MTRITRSFQNRRASDLHGPNPVEEKKSNEYLQFLSWFWGPIPWMN